MYCGGKRATDVDAGNLRAELLRFDRRPSPGCQERKPVDFLLDLLGFLPLFLWLNLEYFSYYVRAAWRSKLTSNLAFFEEKPRVRVSSANAARECTNLRGLLSDKPVLRCPQLDSSNNRNTLRKSRKWSYFTAERNS